MDAAHYQLKRNNFYVLLLATVFAGVFVYATVRDGFDLAALLLSSVLALAAALFFEFLWRIRGSVKFHDLHLEVSVYKWGLASTVRRTIC